MSLIRNQADFETIIKPIIDKLAKKGALDKKVYSNETLKQYLNSAYVSHPNKKQIQNYLEQKLTEAK